MGKSAASRAGLSTTPIVRLLTSGVGPCTVPATVFSPNKLKVGDPVTCTLLICGPWVSTKIDRALGAETLPARSSAVTRRVRVPSWGK